MEVVPVKGKGDAFLVKIRGAEARPVREFVNNAFHYSVQLKPLASGTEGEVG